MKPLGLAFIGLHHQHPRWYFPLWANLPQYKPLAVAEADEGFLKSENAFFKLEACADYRRVLDRKDVDVVAIWLPHSRMPAAVTAAAAAGKHVIVEKPCAADLAGAQAIVETAARCPAIKISAPYCWRTHPASACIREAIGWHGGRRLPPCDADRRVSDPSKAAGQRPAARNMAANDGRHATGNCGVIGPITAMEGRLNAGGAWRYVRDNALWMLRSSEGGGPMWNLGVHWIDYFRWMTGQEVVSVYGAVGGPAGQPLRDIEDNAQAVLKFSGGAVGVLDISYGLTDAHPGKRDIYVSFRGTKGDIQWAPAWEGVKDEVLIVGEDAADRQTRARRVEVTSRAIPGYCGHMAWAWLADFAAAVTENRPPLVTPADILAAIEVVDAFKRSVRSGKAETVGSRE